MRKKKLKSKLPTCPMCFGKGHLSEQFRKSCSLKKSTPARLKKLGLNVKERKHRPVIARCLSHEELTGIKARDGQELDPLDPLCSTYSSRDRHNLLCHLAFLKTVFDELRDENGNDS